MGERVPTTEVLANFYRRLFTPFTEPKGEIVIEPSHTVEVLEQHWDEPLEELFKRLIAARDGVNTDDVTVQYIHEMREKKLYPTTRYDISSEYGGYDQTNLAVLTGQELDALAKDGEAKLEALIASARAADAPAPLNPRKL